MRKILVLALAAFLAGCSYGADEIKKVITDPHYKQYQQKQADLENQYLKGQVVYPDYLKQKKALEEQYTKEVKERENIIHSDTP